MIFQNGLTDNAKRRAIVALWACAAGLLLCLPELLMPAYRAFYARHFPEQAAQWSLSGRFRAIPTFDSRDDSEYAARMHDAARRLIPGDPHIKENRSLRLALTDTLSFALMGAMARLCGGRVGAGWVLSRFAGVALWVVGLYLLLIELSGNVRWSVFAAVFTTLFVDVLDLAFFARWDLAGTFKQVLLHSSYYLGHYPWTFGAGRLSNPALTWPPLFFALWLLLRAKRAWGWALGAGLAGASLFYFHPDVGVIFSAAAAFFFLWRPDRRTFAAVALTGLLGLPWLVVHLGMSSEMLVEAGMKYGRHVDTWALAWTAAAAAMLWKARREPAPVLLGCVVLSACLILEAQGLVGRSVSPNHWNRLGAFFAFLLGAGLLGRKIADRRAWLWLAAVCAAWAAGRAISYAQARYPYQALPKDLDDAYAFLDANVPPDSVVASLGPLENMFLPIYTREKNFVGYGFIIACDVPARELVQRQRRAFALLGIPDGKIVKELARHDGASSNRLWQDALWNGRVDWQDREWSMFGVNDDLPRADYVKILESLARTPPDQDAELDYLWVGPFERSLMTPAALTRLGRPVYRNATVSIYRASAEAKTNWKPSARSLGTSSVRHS